MFRAFPLIILVSLVGITSAAEPPTVNIALDECLLGCDTAFGGFTFAQTGSGATDPYYDTTCLSKTRVKNLYLCSIYYGCTPEQIRHGASFTDGNCLAYGGVHQYTREEVGVPESLTKADVAAMNLTFMSYTDYNDPPTDPIDYIIMPDAHLYALGYRTETVWDKQDRLNHVYGYALISLWAIVMLIGMIYRIFNLLKDSWSTTQTLIDNEEAHSSQNPTLWSRFRAYVLLPPLFRYHNRKTIGQMTIPPRVESFLIGAYIVINIALNVCNFETFDENLYWSDRTLQYTRYLADRSGLLAQANLQMVFLFGTRNNVFLWLTNMSFGSFNRFHRWIARICIVQIIAHSAAYTQYAFDTESWESSWLEEYWYSGEIATIAFCLMGGLSVLWLRKHTYDFFLMAHIVLALLGLITLWYHLNVFEGLYDSWMWPLFAFWSFDRLVRLLRLAAVWVSAPKGRACVEYDEAADIVRVDVSEYLKKLKPKPGSFYFLYTPSRLLGWESHPFTLVEWTPESDVSSNTSNSSPANSTHGHLAVGNNMGKDQSIAKASDVHQSTTAGDKKYTFIIRPHKGFTNRLRNYAKTQPERARRMPIMIEGPYGSVHRIKGYSDVLMIVGGTGINVAINYIHDILNGRDKSVNIKLVWALRFTSFLQSVLDRELKDVVKSGRVIINVYITRRENKVGYSTPSSLDANEKGNTEDWNIINPAVSKVSFERPNCAVHVAAAAEAAPGKLAVVVCGPATMADDTRVAVIREIKSSHPSTAFFEEDYGW